MKQFWKYVFMGFKQFVISCWAAICFVAAIGCFYKTAISGGYLSVLCFFEGVAMLLLFIGWLAIGGWEQTTNTPTDKRKEDEGK